MVRAIVDTPSCHQADDVQPGDEPPARASGAPRPVAHGSEGVGGTQPLCEWPAPTCMVAIGQPMLIRSGPPYRDHTVQRDRARQDEIIENEMAKSKPPLRAVPGVAETFQV
jgi:hypothetical protein